VIVPETVTVDCPETPDDGALVDSVIVDVAPKAASGPRTRKAANMIVASVLIVFISITE
jgi:hypothetical protein